LRAELQRGDYQPAFECVANREQLIGALAGGADIAISDFSTGEFSALAEILPPGLAKAASAAGPVTEAAAAFDASVSKSEQATKANGVNFILGSPCRTNEAWL